MATNLQIDEDLKDEVQEIKDQAGNASLMSLSNNRVVIGHMDSNPFAESEFMLGQRGSGLSSLITLTRRAEAAAQHVAFRLDPDNKIFQIDVGGRGNSRARIHFGEMGSNNNPLTTMGNVGIGTHNPTEQLEVHGNILATGDVQLSGADCAEEFRIEENSLLDPGTVMVIGDEETLHHCKEAYDRKVAGVISGAGGLKPGIVLGKQLTANKRMPLALSGKVYCKADASYSPIETGDLLTTSPTPGYAMKAMDPFKAFGAVLGKALRPLNEDRGLIPVLITLH